MSTTITTFLTYDTQAEEAAKLYTSLFDGAIKETMRAEGRLRRRLSRTGTPR